MSIARTSTLFAADTGTFIPSAIAMRQHHARLDADRIIDEFINDFTRKEFFPEGGQSLLFAMLTQLPQWSADTSIQVVDEDGKLIASYSKGIDPAAIQRVAVLVLDDESEYVVADEALASAPEALFQVIFSQLGVGALLGEGGNFPGNSSVLGRVATVRELISGLAAANRPLLFDALLADANETRNAPQAVSPNPFLPFALLQPTGRTDVLEQLCAIYAQTPVEHLEHLLARMPLSETEEDDFLTTFILPEAFLNALNASVDESRRIRAIDGILHARSHDPDTDQLARELTGKLLLERTQRELAIVEPGQAGYQPAGDGNNPVVLWHDGRGSYLAEDLGKGEINGFRQVGSDSFYRAISSLLLPHERQAMGLSHELDLAGFRKLVADMAVQGNGGWFDLAGEDSGKKQQLPEWMTGASESDRDAWNTAFSDYAQALLEAQTPALPDVTRYGHREAIRDYTRARLQARLIADLGLSLDPGDIVVETYHAEVPDGGITDFGEGYVQPTVPVDIEYTTQRRTLTDLCLENLSILDIDFLLSARTVDNHGAVIPALTSRYVFNLVRDLNVGDSYARFLTKTLLDLPSGEWYRERFAQVMQAQLSLDAIEAKMGGDFLEDGTSPVDRADRGYKWVRAVVAHPVDDDNRPLIEGHRVEVQLLRVNGVPLHGLLIIAASSRLSVPSVVVYTPGAPDGVCLRELESIDELLPRLLHNPAFLEYLVPLADPPLRNNLRHSLASIQYIPVLTTEAYSGNFMHALYENEVKKVFDDVDAQTTTTWEANWQTFWEVTRSIGEIALEFTPFRVRLPLAALRSLYALSRGLRGGSNAPLHFTQALLLLADGLPMPRRVRVRSAPRSSPRSTLSPRTAVTTAPAGLTLRADGVFKGVYEKANPGGPSSFYIRHDGRAHLVRYDACFSTWRLIDSRRPDAYYQQPVRFSEQGGWSHNQVGLPGGKPNKWERIKQQGAAKPAKKKGGKSEPAGPSTSADQTTGRTRPGFTVNIEGFFDSPAFRQAQKVLPDDDVRAAVEKAVEKYHLDRKAGNLHLSDAGRFSLDLPGVGNSIGRGAYRLLMLPGTGLQKGQLIPSVIRDPHKK